MIYPYLHQLPQGTHKVYRPRWKFWAATEYLEVRSYDTSMSITYTAYRNSKKQHCNTVILGANGRLLNVVCRSSHISVSYPAKVNPKDMNFFSNVAEKVANRVSSLVPQLEIYK